MTSEEYKKLSLKEFDQAATKFDDNDPSVYNMCRKDYPDILAEVMREPFFMSLHRVLRPEGRLVLRDMASNSRLVRWFVNHIEIPIMNKVLHKGDVHIYSKVDIQRLCDASGLKLERYEVRKGFRLHCVVRRLAIGANEISTT